MDVEARARSLGRQIAKVLDEEGVKPPLRPQAWIKIQALIVAELKDIEEQYD